MKGPSHRGAHTLHAPTTLAGFSLLEVIIATALLMGSAVVLAKLAGMGRDQAQAAQTITAATQLCEQTLHELLLGLRPLVPAEDTPLLPAELPTATPDPILETPAGRFLRPPQNPAAPAENSPPLWRHSIRTQTLPNLPGLWCLTVEVREGDQQQSRRRYAILSRWISGPPPAGAFDALERTGNPSGSSFPPIAPAAPFTDPGAAAP